MISLILAVGSTVLMAAPVSPKAVDMTSFRNELIEARTSMVRSFAQVSKAFMKKLSPEQKSYLLQTNTEEGKAAFAFIIVGIPEICKQLDVAIESVGGKELTEDEFRTIYEDELND